MAILADIKGISNGVQIFLENTTPKGHFVAGANINGTSIFYLLEGTLGADGATVKGRIEVPRTGGCMTGSKVYFIGSMLAGGKAAGTVSSFEDAYNKIADKE